VTRASNTWENTTKGGGRTLDDVNLEMVFLEEEEEVDEGIESSLEAKDDVSSNTCSSSFSES
jgi:hypothetical protein